MTRTSSVITIVSARGGTGKTIIAINLAVALAQAGKRVALVDFDRFGDVALLLDIQVARGIADLAAIDGEITADDLTSCIYTHSGVTILPAPVRPEHIERAVELLGQTHDYVVIDAPGNYVVIDAPGTFNDNVARALEITTKVVLVCTPDDKVLADTLLDINLMRSWGFPQDKIHLVLNSTNNVGVDSLGVERALGLKVVCSVPYDRSISQPTQWGMPLLISDPMSEAAKSISRLAQGLIAETLEFPTATDQDSAAPALLTPPAAPPVAPNTMARKPIMRDKIIGLVCLLIVVVAIGACTAFAIKYPDDKVYQEEESCPALVSC